jgi:atypical dual specificity phosphatase
MLILHRVEIRRCGESVVRHASLHAQMPGLLFIVGPGGAGKSSVLTALSHTADGTPVLESGLATLGGVSLSSSEVLKIWVPQHEQLTQTGSAMSELVERYGVNAEEAGGWLEAIDAGNADALLKTASCDLSLEYRRFLAVMGSLSRSGDAYFVDEPTAGLEEAAATLVRNRLAELATRRAVVVATHNRRDCLAHTSTTALLAGGTIQECADSAQFFQSPTTEAGRTYAETGNCGLPWASRHSEVRGGIWWLVPNLLCGLSRPGISATAVGQFQELFEKGVRILVCVEERCLYSQAAPRENGLELHHFSVPDMAPPTFNQAIDICRLAEPAIRANKGIAVHCRGGLGRTGTVLAAILIWFGDAAESAISKVRAARPMAIQTSAQSRFLLEFADRIRDWR